MKKKNKFIRLRVDEDEEKKIKEIVEQSRFSTIADFFRYLINDYEKNTLSMVGYKPEQNCKEYTRSYHLSRIGNNLNQIAYILNKTHLEGIISDSVIENAMKEIMYLNVLMQEEGRG